MPLGQLDTAPFDPLYDDGGECEAQFPRSHYTRSQAITEARREFDWVFEDYRRSEMEAVASAVRHPTERDLEDGWVDCDPDHLGTYWMWCKPNEPGAIPSWLVRVKRKG